MQQQQIKEIREAFIAFFSDAFGKKPTDDQTDVQCLFDAADAQAGTLNFKIFVTFQPDESCWISVKSLNEKLREWHSPEFDDFWLLSPSIEEEPLFTAGGAPCVTEPNKVTGSEFQFFAYVRPLYQAAARWIVPAEDWELGSLGLGDKLEPGNHD